MLELWEEVGFCSFHQGLFWFIDPDDWMDSLMEFHPVGDSKAIPIIRSSFCNFIFLSEDGHVYQINPITARKKEIAFSLDLFMLGMMQMKDYEKDAFFENLHQKALRILGRIASDECYGFEPLLSLGGSEDVENMVKVKAREHLSLIAQTL